MKLGKQAARHDPRTLMMARYIKAENLPATPDHLDYSAVAAWPMMLNDSLGDCTIAAAGHMIEQWSKVANPPGITPANGDILRAYEAVGGYKLGDPSSDNGAVMMDVLKYWRKSGIAGRVIAGFVGLEPKNHQDIRDAVFLFGNCYIGLQLPLSAQDQPMWSVATGGTSTPQGAPGGWGGHAVPIVGYDARGLIAITWGAPLRLTWNFLDAYCDEAYAVLSDDWISAKTKLSPEFLNLLQLEADLKAI